ncbi:hypothetical protein [Paenibacillus crassostreae]|uniref:hypothetical protein n=1 Tax=Paenibacillus crassostreae TaxID=1763538 RepID=UPI000A50D080|nr:hypothetical protein [Paenibacillus crassostreae]
MHKRKHTAAEKFTIIQEIESGHIGVKAATQKFGVTKTTLAKPLEALACNMPL